MKESCNNLLIAVHPLPRQIVGFFLASLPQAVSSVLGWIVVLARRAQRQRHGRPTGPRRRNKLRSAVGEAAVERFDNWKTARRHQPGAIGELSPQQEGD